jgi:hypothetical protein
MSAWKKAWQISVEKYYISSCSWHLIELAKAWLIHWLRWECCWSYCCGKSGSGFRSDLVFLVAAWIKIFSSFTITTSVHSWCIWSVF